MISHKLVTEFGGEFSIDSDIGRGTTFSFTILLKDSFRSEDQEEVKIEGSAAVNSLVLKYKWKPPMDI
jgi:hypothetical protein